MRARTALPLLLLLALGLLPLRATALTGVFYQPQLRDRAVDEAAWRRLLQAVRAGGVDTLVLQWSRYGDAFADPDGRAWLASRLRAARAAGLQVVIGLAFDPAFFQRQERPDAELGDYLRRLREDDADLARAWQAQLPAEDIAGWYLPMEVDDRRWRGPEARAALLRYLAGVHEQLGGGGKPVYVTSFFTGNTAPERYQEFLQALGGSGVRLWVQDGAGTAKLGEPERRLYLQKAAGCRSGRAAGIVVEMFRQTGSDQAFAAVPLPAPEAARRLARRAPCGRDTLFFSLRYLPAAAGVLPVAP